MIVDTRDAKQEIEQENVRQECALHKNHFTQRSKFIFLARELLDGV